MPSQVKGSAALPGLVAGHAPEDGGLPLDVPSPFSDLCMCHQRWRGCPFIQQSITPFVHPPLALEAINREP